MMIHRRFKRLLAVLMCVSLLVIATMIFSSPRASADDPVVIKLGTLAPEGSIWYKSLRDADQRIRQTTGSKVQLKIYPGGVSGNESAIVRKIRINQLQAGTVTAVGLIDIERSSLSLQLPMVIESFDELRFIRDKMAPMLNARIEEKGFKVLGWGEIGWSYFFTQKPVTTVSQLKAVKLFAWEGDPPATEAFRKVGLKPVTVPSTDLLPALQTGMIEGFPTSPLSALSMQWFGLAKNMLNVRWSPMVGATVISTKAWEKVPADLRPKVAEIMLDSVSRLNQDVLRMDTEAINQMKTMGLTVNEPANLPEWNAFATEMRNAMRGSVILPDSMDKVLELHREWKSKN